VPAARGQAPSAGAATLAGSGLLDAVSWWGEPGRAGESPGAWFGMAPPAALAGLVRGGWRLDEPRRAPSATPWPGVCQVRSPLVWYDSLEVRGKGEGALAGFDETLASVCGHAAPGERRAHATFSLVNGRAGLDENAFTLARGDSLRGFGVDVANGKRGAMGGLLQAGRHEWGARTRLKRGRHQFEACVAQRGAAAVLGGLEEQSASGQSGTAAWRWQRGGTGWTAAYTRGLDRHESFGGRLTQSSREAQETRLEAGFGQVRGGRDLGARVEWTEASVKRFGSGAFSRECRGLWGAVRAELPAAGGRLDLALGAGRHGGVDRFDVAPSAEYQVRARGLDAALGIERLLTPVWADLAEGTDPFLQRAWIGTMRLSTARPGAWRARGALRAGRVYSRALLERLPLEELWLRRGIRSEFGTYDLALAEGGLEWEGRHVGAGLEGFGLAHRSTATPAGIARATRSDPDAGFRTWLGGDVMLLGGDLGVELRGEAAGAGACEAQVEPLRRVPAFVTFSLVCQVTLLEDAIIVVRARNLEDRVRPQLWTDSATGLPAVSERRNLTLSFVWRLFN
jgi:hypothetical protein